MRRAIVIVFRVIIEWKSQKTRYTQSMLRPLYAVSVLGLLSASLGSCSLPTQSDGSAAAQAELAACSASPVHVQWDTRTGLANEVSGDFPGESGPTARVAAAFLTAHPGLFGVAADQLELTSERTSPMGTHVRFRQVVQGRPVYGAEVAVHLRSTPAGQRVFLVRASLRRRPAVQGSAMAPDDALKLALRAAALPAAHLEDSTAIVMPDGRTAWQIELRQASPLRALRAVIASDGSVVELQDLFKHVDGTGWIFDPNPVATTGDFSLADNANADSPVLTSQRILVTLPELDGTGDLSGPYVNAYNSSNMRANEPGLVFDYTRSNDFFEEVMAYYHIDRARRGLASMGFTSIMSWPINVQVNGKQQDNSWYDTKKKTIMFGAGGVDDAEDADVILHEYAHAVVADQVPGFGMYYPGAAIDEGWADFFAAALHSQTSPYLVDKACLAPWDATSYAPPPCLRRTDTNKHNPEFATLEVHADGEMMSGALWEAAQTVGMLEMLRIEVQSHYLLTTTPTFQQVADSLILTDQQTAGGAHAELFRRLLTWRGLSATITPPSNYAGPWESHLQSVQSQTPYTDLHDEWFDVTHPGATAIRLHFASFSTEAGADHVYLYDPQVHLYAIYDGALGAFDSVVIPGDTVRVRLVSNAKTGNTGYSIDHYDVPSTGDGGVLDPPDVVDAAEEPPADAVAEDGWLTQDGEPDDASSDVVQPEAALDSAGEAAVWEGGDAAADDATEEPEEHDAAEEWAQDATPDADASEAAAQDAAPGSDALEAATEDAPAQDAVDSGEHDAPSTQDAADAAKLDAAPLHEAGDATAHDAPEDGAAPGTADAQDAGGCGCQVPSRHASIGAWAAMLALVAALRRRRLRRPTRAPALLRLGAMQGKQVTNDVRTGT
jgi:Zn-dependent metalloprotease